MKNSLHFNIGWLCLQPSNFPHLYPPSKNLMYILLTLSYPGTFARISPKHTTSLAVYHLGLHLFKDLALF